MSSHLTRLVFRQLLAEELVTYHGCLRHPRLPQRQTLRHASRPSVGTVQRRTFFNFLKKPDRQVQEADMDPGMEKMMEYSKMERLKARLPPPEDVARALDAFSRHKEKTKESVVDDQMQHVIRAFRYLQQHEFLSMEILVQILRWSGARPKVGLTRPVRISRGELTLAAYSELQKQCKDQGIAVPLEHVYNSVRALSIGGMVVQARDILVDAFNNADAALSGEEVTEGGDSRMLGKGWYDAAWVALLKGCANEEGNEQEMLKTLDMMNHFLGTNPSPQACATISGYYVSKDDAANARLWYEKMTSPQSAKTKMEVSEAAKSYEDLLGLCIKRQDLAFGQVLIRDVVTNWPYKSFRDLIFVWAAGTGKGVDEIDRMMDVMQKAHKHDSGQPAAGSVVDIETINKLVKLAMSRNDPYSAERFIDLGRKRDIQPNGRTLVLQMDYRLSVNDVDGALVAYKHLQAQDLSSQRDVPTVNRLICAMCGSGRHDFESIMNVAGDLSDRRARFLPQTVSTLTLLHLARGEYEDVADLLNTHVFHYGSEDRAMVRKDMIGFCLKPATSVAQAWDAYIIIRQVFDEMDRGQRTRLMEEFFRRRRSDMAVHVFNHMRTHTRADTMATAETYVSCLRGIAQLKDEESLEAVHNQFKLDYSIEPTTRLLNALILGYTACDHARRALGFWDEIAASREGPNMSSIHLAFRACEASPWGDKKAREIWGRLQRAGVDLEPTLWASYAGALIGNGNVIGAISELEQAESQGLVAMTSLM